jgi:hypothetical protein
VEGYCFRNGAETACRCSVCIKHHVVTAMDHMNRRRRHGTPPQTTLQRWFEVLWNTLNGHVLEHVSRRRAASDTAPLACLTEVLLSGRQLQPCRSVVLLCSTQHALQSLCCPADQPLQHCGGALVGEHVESRVITEKTVGLTSRGATVWHAGARQRRGGSVGDGGFKDLGGRGWDLGCLQRLFAGQRSSCEYTPALCMAAQLHRNRARLSSCPRPTRARAYQYIPGLLLAARHGRNCVCRARSTLVLRQLVKYHGLRRQGCTIEARVLCALLPNSCVHAQHSP